MALLHEATLTPTKIQLLEEWLPGRRWYPGDGAPKELGRVGACRFDDPAGEVGIEILLVRDGDGPLLHTPLTYRGAPLPGGERWLIGTMEHSVLGARWVYDAAGDPVYIAVLAEAIRTGGREAEEFVDTPGGQVPREPLMSVRGSGRQARGTAAEVVRVDEGDPTVVVTNLGELAIRRVLTDTPPDAGLTLDATWAGHPSPLPIVVLG